MMDDARGNNCQATNLFRALGMTSEAAALGLLDVGIENSRHGGLHLLIQTLHRFLMEKFINEGMFGGRQQPQILLEEMGKALTESTNGNNDVGVPVISQVCGVRFTNETICMVCRNSSIRSNYPSFVDLTYPKVCIF
jgi:PAB-dependent poly(A)-specific ribonuclease subunit 2